MERWTSILSKTLTSATVLGMLFSNMAAAETYSTTPTGVGLSDSRTNTLDDGTTEYVGRYQAAWLVIDPAGVRCFQGDRDGIDPGGTHPRFDPVVHLRAVKKIFPQFSILKTHRGAGGFTFIQSEEESYTSVVHDTRTFEQKRAAYGNFSENEYCLVRALTNQIQPLYRVSLNDDGTSDYIVGKLSFEVDPVDVEPDFGITEKGQLEE